MLQIFEGGLCQVAKYKDIETFCSKLLGGGWEIKYVKNFNAFLYK